MPFINVHASTKYIGSHDVVSVDVSDDEWSELSEDERYKYENEILEDYMSNVVDLWTTVTDEPEGGG